MTVHAISSRLDIGDVSQLVKMGHHTDISEMCLWVGWAFASVSYINQTKSKSVTLSVCVWAYLTVRALKRKRLELSTPNSMAGPRYASTLRSKSQRTRLQCYQVQTRRTRRSQWVCMSVRLHILVDTTVRINGFTNIIPVINSFCSSHIGSMELESCSSLNRTVLRRTWRVRQLTFLAVDLSNVRVFNKTSPKSFGKIASLSQNYATEVPLVTMGRHKFTPKTSLWRSPPPSNTPILRPTPLIIPNGIRIQSAILPQYTFQTDRQTDRPTDRPTDRHTHTQTDRWARRQVYTISAYARSLYW